MVLSGAINVDVEDGSVTRLHKLQITWQRALPLTLLQRGANLLNTTLFP